MVLARIEVDRRKALTALEQSKRVPDVTVSVGMQRSNETQRNVLLFGVSVPLPVFDRNQGNLLEALKLEDKAQDELQSGHRAPAQRSGAGTGAPFDDASQRFSR